MAVGTHLRLKWIVPGVIIGIMVFLLVSAAMVKVTPIWVDVNRVNHKNLQVSTYLLVLDCDLTRW